ncbi:hypothetical protein [Polymorphospora sp. NPDC050346]|uniref:hypothetical protein n=1 Tax=Polymorphospora sp. NPDC050346 TaxID=3155780 RepID=UPI0033D2D193
MTITTTPTDITAALTLILRPSATPKPTNPESRITTALQFVERSRATVAATLDHLDLCDTVDTWPADRTTDQDAAERIRTAAARLALHKKCDTCHPGHRHHAARLANHWLQLWRALNRYVLGTADADTIDQAATMVQDYATWMITGDSRYLLGQAA